MSIVKVDFSNIVKPVKPVHGVCCAPYVQSGTQPHVEKYFKEGNIPYCRLHDCMGDYGGSYFVDVTNVFPNFDADETNPENYDFTFTDDYIGTIQKSGCEAYYRLGETIEWGIEKRRTQPPKDFSKWARICEHIIAHYNKGWANGFHYDIKYWEIWNEPDCIKIEDGCGSMWQTTDEEFFRLYEVASKHLKEKFPEIKIGGYSSCGFYYAFRETFHPEINYHPGVKKYITFFHNFMEMAKKESCPLDFFSWHLYASNVDEMLAYAKYARENLDKYGFTQTECHLNEWNINAEGHGFRDKHTAVGASFNGAILAEMQHTSNIDLATYYCFSNHAIYNGFLDQNDGSVGPAWYPFVAFGKLYALGTEVETHTDTKGIYAVAATKDAESAIMVTNYLADCDKVTVCFSGFEESKKASVKFIDDDRFLVEEMYVTVPENGEISFNLPNYTVAFIEFN